MGVPRVVLVLPSATYRAPDFLAAAAALDCEVVVGSEVSQALAAEMGDRALVLPLDRPELAAERIAEHAGRVAVDAVVGVDDQGVLVAALAAARLGLAGNPPDAVAATRNKATQRRRLADAGVAQPSFRVVGSRDDVGRAAREVGPPVVVKPLSLSGSQGVIRVDGARDAAGTAERVRHILAFAGRDPNEPLLVEEFVPGDEVALEGILAGGAVQALALFDKPDPLDGPYFEESLYVTPSRLPEERQSAVERLVGEAAVALGLREGPIHAEVRMAGSDAWVLELAARSIGGLCSRALRFGAGISLEELILRHALGLPVDDLVGADGASGVMMIPIPASGTLEGVDGVPDAAGLAGVEGVEITIPRGRPVRALPEGDRYLGFVFARGDTPAQVEATLRAAFERLDVRIR